MAPKTKQKKKNAFSYFLDDYVEKQESKGRKVSHRIGAEECALLWENMPPEEKQPYIELASINKVLTQKEKEIRFTSFGMSYAEIDKKEQTARNRIDRANKEIGALMKKLDWDTIRKHLFYTIHCHHLVKIEDDIYVPGEIAVCEFNLQSGIIKTYHRLINSGPLPVGYGFEAKHRRETVHDLPIPPYEDGASDYLQILNDLLQFTEAGCSSSGKLPPFYTEEEEIPVVESILQQFSDKLGQGQTFFRVYPIHKLFFEIKNKCVELADDKTSGFPVLTVALMEIEKDTYRYVCGISCKYHTPSDEFYHACSLSVVQRYVYVICDHCCQYLKIPLIPGRHVRVDADVGEQLEESSQKKTIRTKEEKLWPEEVRAFEQQNRFAFLDEEEAVADVKPVSKEESCRDVSKSGQAKNGRDFGRAQNFSKRVVKN